MSRTGKKGGGSGGLGRAIFKERSRGKRTQDAGSWLHTSELDDGYDWNKLNLRSVTEENQLDEFLRTAELAGTEFTAEKLNIRVVDPSAHNGLPSQEEAREIERTHSQFSQYIGIPRRPQWGSNTTPEELELSERDSFLTWRRNLAKLEEGEGLLFTPFEKNLVFWRQLWRVIERSDIIVQIVDARNPLLFRCEDLEKYVKELDAKKVNLLLISKADLLSWKRRLLWAQYFSERGIAAAFWSAQAAAEEEEEEEEEEATTTTTTTKDVAERVEGDTESEGEEGESDTEESVDPAGGEGEVGEGGEGEVGEEADSTGRERQELADHEALDDSSGSITMEIPAADDGARLQVCPDLLSREKLLQLFLELSPVPIGELTTVGLVGYPNVGKSSTINVLYQEKKVPVSATPGRTKHFQTLFVSDRLMLCDCPGLVFPSLISTKAEMVVSGILPIDQMRHHIPPVSLVCQRIPRSTLERVYSLRLPLPAEGENPNRPPTALELLSAYGYLHGYMTQHGMPDCPRSARYILKDYVNGKLLFCHCPPGVDPDTFNSEGGEMMRAPLSQGPEEEESASENTTNGSARKPSQFDQQYFQQEQVRAISKGRHGVRGFVRKSDANRHHSSEEVREEGEGDGVSDTASSVASSLPGNGKPWKKHNNRHKKEKTRRTTQPLNQ